MRERRQEKKQVFKVKLLRLPAKVDQDKSEHTLTPGSNWAQFLPAHI